MIDLPPVPKLWLPSRPAIVRASELPEDLRKGVFAPGFRCPPVASGPSLALRGTPTTSTGASVNKPTGVVAGDLLIILQASHSSSTITLVTPSGFTELDHDTVTVSLTHNTMQMAYRVADGSEGSSFTGMNSTTNVKICAAFSGGIASVTPSAWLSSFLSGNPSPQTIASGSGAPPLIALAGFYYSGTLTGYSWSGGTETQIDAGGSGNALRLSYLIQQATPANATVDIGNSGTTGMMSGYIACA